MSGRHHAVQECLRRLCVSAGIPAKQEFPIDTSGQRPADVFLPNFFRGTVVAMHVTVSHPSQSTFMASDSARPRQAASERAALDTEVPGPSDARNVHFQAVAVCSLGGWLPDGEDLVKETASRAAACGSGHLGGSLSH